MVIFYLATYIENVISHQRQQGCNLMYNFDGAVNFLKEKFTEQSESLREKSQP